MRLPFFVFFEEKIMMDRRGKRQSFVYGDEGFLGFLSKGGKEEF